AWKDACNAGRATFTTVLSINAMLEPTIVAARIQGPTASMQGARAGISPITASSQGGFMDVPHRNQDYGPVVVNLKSSPKPLQLPDAWRSGKQHFLMAA